MGEIFESERNVVILAQGIKVLDLRQVPPFWNHKASKATAMSKIEPKFRTF